MKIYAILIGIFLLSWFINLTVKKIAPRIGAVDHPNDRRMNLHATPNLGGISIFLSLITADLVLKEPPYLNKILFGALIIVVVGVLDDLYEIKPLMKLLGQIATASVAYFSGMQFGYHPLVSYLFVVFWFVLVMNAFNFLDGIDGLVGGMSTIIFLCFGLTNENFLTISMIMFASIAGFLFHNFSKKKIYLGDTGSMLLGYLIASFLGIEYFSKSLYYYPIPFIYIGLVLYDIVYVTLDRKIRKEKVWKAEKNHIHHRIIEKIKSQKKALIILYGLTFIFCGIARWLQYKIHIFM